MDNQPDTTTETYTTAGHELMAKLRRVTEATRAVRDNAPCATTRQPSTKTEVAHSSTAKKSPKSHYQ